MNLFESELEVLKNDFVHMWELVSSQLRASLSALASMDRERAREVIASEKTVNELDLKIDKNCENIIALHNPVAVDLRFVLALIKINSNLEKIGDIASRISKFVVKAEDSFYEDLLNKTEALTMFEEVCELIDGTLMAFKQNDSEQARLIFAKDEYINSINKTAFESIISEIKDNPNAIEKYLKMLSLLRRIEKAGDISKDIAEEIIFYVEAKVIRHNTKKISVPEKANVRNKLKVLIWIQNKNEEEVVKQMFKESDYECLVCNTKAELDALISKNSHLIGLAIIDSSLKDTDVLSLCKELKQNELLETYVMILDGNTHITELDALDHGADFYIEKPINPGILSLKINAVLERKR